MPRPRKDSEFWHCRLEKTIDTHLREFCKDTGLPRTATVEKALKLYLKRYKETGKI